MFIDILGLLELVAIGAEFIETLQTLLGLVDDEPEPDYALLTSEEKLEMLKRLTLIIVRLNVDVNCYPLGYQTTLMFEPDGTPIP